MNIVTTLKPSGLKLLALIALACAATTLSSQGQTTWYWNGNVSQDWTNPNNFQRQGDNAAGVPVAGDYVVLESWGARDPLINNSGNAALTQILLSHNMTVAAGGVLSATYFKVGWDASATLTMSGGSLTAGNHLDVGGYNGGTATMNVSGNSSITVGGLYLNLNGVSTGASYLNLDGGTLTDTGTLSINSSHPADLDLGGGTLIVPSSQLGNVDYWIANHNITAYEGASTVNISTVGGNLVLTAVPIPEPSAIALLGSAAAVGFVMLRRKK